MDSIFEKLDYWANKNPEKLLYAFLDINGNQIEKYSYKEFIHRTKVIAGNLHQEGHFKKNDRILLAFPSGLEMLCAFFACARLGLIPVPVYPPASHGFEAALHKMIYIAKDCQAAAILTSKDYYWSIKLNLSRTSISNFNLKGDYISKLKWVNTEDFRELNKNDFPESYSEILFLQYTSGSTSDPKGVIVTHKNIRHNCDIVADHMPICVSWLPQHHDMGLIGYYLFSALKGGTTYGFSPINFIQRPALWLETITKYQGTASSAPNFAYEYCLQPGKISKQTLDNVDLSSLKFLMTAAEPVMPSTYLRFLRFFKPYGLKPTSFFAAYGLAENTLAVSNYGRNILSVDKNSLKQNKLKIIPPAAEMASQTEIMSCGKPVGDNIVKIVDPETHCDLKDGNIGEVWISGQSKCLGYWNKPELTNAMFQASLRGENHNANNYLRTGDIGFIYQSELYICGRAKDMIIIRGLNYFPQDIEKIVEDSSDLIRKGGVAAFGIYEGEEERLVVVAGVKNPKAIPDPLKFCEAIRKNLNIQTHAIAFIAARDIPKTSSGKIIRHKIKQYWLEGNLNVLQHFSGPKEIELSPEGEKDISPFQALKLKYGFKGNESCSLGNAGVDSLDLAILMHDIKDLLKEKGADSLSKEIDIRLLQEISVSEFFELAAQFKNSSAVAIMLLKNVLRRLQKEHHRFERNMMNNDVKLIFEPEVPFYDLAPLKTSNVLLTGGTGFFGPFILKSLLQQTNQRIYVLIRADNESHGRERLRLAMESIEPSTPEFIQLFNERVIPVCGDLGQPRLGLDSDTWNSLAKNIQTVYHNGAKVNYLFNYDKMRNINVIGTNEILKLAFAGRAKIFNHISTTFIFGWAVKDILFEKDTNEDIDLLDFGYSQTKWVSEQIVMDAMNHGLKARIFRPALITPSINGGGYNFDISIRLLAFMINHGIGVDALNQVSFTPADIAANNIVAISNLPDTINRTYHVTRDRYANMVDITNIIGKLTDRKFEIFKLPQFVPEVINRCTKDDLLFPLLDFLVRSVDNISSMEFKRYDSSNYQQARNASKWGKQDPSLEDTVNGILLFLQNKGIITV